jgi:hypothetical protein
VPVTVHHGRGSNTVKVNQRAAPPIEGSFISLGTFEFAADKPAAVVVSNADVDGYVVIDAAQWLPVK